MKECTNFEEAHSCDCAACDDKTCEYRKTGNVLATGMKLIFLVIVIAAFIYSTQQLGLTRQEVIEIILIIVFLAMAYAFANLAVGRKKGDQQIINDLKNENDLLSSKNAELQRRIDDYINMKVKVIGNIKLGSKTKLHTMNK